VQQRIYELVSCESVNIKLINFQNVAEMASAAGIAQKIDPTLVQTLRSQKNGEDLLVKIFNGISKVN